MANITLEAKGFDEVLARLVATGALRSVEARVGNNTTYAPWVGSSRFQARIHAGRWTTDEQALTTELDAIRGDFQEAIDVAIASPKSTTNPILVGAQAAAFRIQRRMATYPSKRPGSSYRQTGTYGRRWTTSVEEI